jgi:CO/xanthine dehydrogenase FAD-binding subunit
MGDYQIARTIADVERAVAGRPADGWLVFAGGTDLMVRARARVAEAPVLDVSEVAELRGIAVEGEHIVLGAGVTYTDCLTDSVIRRHVPLLTRVAERFASPAIRNVATLGGNVANASPAGDGIAALWALEARVEAITPAGVVVRSLDEVVVGPGRLALPPGSVLTAIRIPVSARGEGQAFAKLVNRAWPEHPMAISVASVAARLRLDPAGRATLARVVLGAVAPTPVRAPSAEAALEGHVVSAERLADAARCAPEAARPIDDGRAAADYRRDVLSPLVMAALTAALGAARGTPESHG